MDYETYDPYEVFYEEAYSEDDYEEDDVTEFLLNNAAKNLDWEAYLFFKNSRRIPEYDAYE